VNKNILLILLIGVLLLPTMSVAAQVTTCQGPTGAPIPCTPTPEIVVPAPQDSDSDGISDFNDQCPTQPGVSVNNGCPAANDVIAPPTASAPVIFPDSVACLVTGFGQNVNIRSGPGLDYAVINVLEPGSFVITYFLLINAEGEGWYSTLPGWVADVAVQGNANCDGIPVVTSFPEARAVFIPDELRDLAAAPPITDGAPPPDTTCDGEIIITEEGAFCRLDLDRTLPGGSSEGAPPPPPFCEDGEIVIINGGAYCRLNLDLVIAGGTSEGAPPPEPFCQNGEIVIINGGAYCRLDLDFTIARDGTEGAPPPPPFCEDGTVIIINGGAYCRLDLDFTTAGGTSEGAPLPGPFCEGGTVVVIDGQAYCRLDLDFTIARDGTEGAPPPPPFCEDGEIVIINGGAYCRLDLDLTIAGGTSEGAPPSEPFCEDGTVVVIDGQAYCRLDLDFTIARDGTEGAPPPPPFCEEGEIVIINGGAYCRLTLDLTIAGGTSEGTPLPDPFTCEWQVVIDGSVICLISEEIAELGIAPSGDPTAARGEHILLARQVGVSAATCAEVEFKDNVRSARELGSRMVVMTVQDLIALPETDDPCAFEVMVIAVENGVPQVFEAEGGVIVVMDVLRIPVPGDQPPPVVNVSMGAAGYEGQLCVTSEGTQVCTTLP